LFLNNGEVKQDLRLIPFSLLLMTSTVWSEIFAFHLAVVENSLVVFVMPYIAFYVFYGFLNRRIAPIVASFISLVITFSVYQTMLIVFLVYIFVLFMILQLNTNEKPRTYNLLVPKILILLALAYLANLGIGKLFLKYFALTHYEYLDKMFRWKTVGIKDGLKSLWNYFLLFSVGKSKITTIHYFLPAVLTFLSLVIYLAVKKINKHQRLFFILAGFAIPLCALIIPILGAGYAPWRSMWTVPFATAIMLFFPTVYFRKVFAKIVMIVAMLCALYQAQVTSGMYYSDHLRFQDDTFLAHELNKLIVPLEDDAKTIPVAIIGKHRTAKDFHKNYIEGELVGRSFFGFPGSYQSATGDGLAFMHQIGMDYTYANSEQLEAALKELQTNPIPSFPNPACAIKFDIPINTAAIEEQEKKLQQAKLLEVSERALMSDEKLSAVESAETAFKEAETLGLAAQDKARIAAAVQLTGDTEKDDAARADYNAALAEFNTANEAYLKAQTTLAEAQGEIITRALADQKAAEAAIEELNKVKQIVIIHLSDDLTAM
jgi:hypothetical protein